MAGDQMNGLPTTPSEENSTIEAAMRAGILEQG